MASTVDRQHVWDLPTRIFHWLLVVLLGFSWWSAENHHMDWHRISGIIVFGLIVFRILWGLFGTSTARFSQFLKGPRTVWSYVRPSGSARTVAIGHNPLGGWSVIAMLLLLCVQVGSVCSRSISTASNPGRFPIWSISIKGGPPRACTS